FTAALMAFAVPFPCGAAEASTRAVFEIHSTRERPEFGPLESLGADGSVVLGGSAPARISSEELVALQQRGVLPPAWPTGEQVVCANGDRIPGHVVRLRDERIRMTAELSRKAELAFSVTALSFLWLATPDGLEDVEAHQQRLRREARTSDVVTLRNGDRVDGTVVALDERSVRVDAEGKS